MTFLDQLLWVEGDIFTDEYWSAFTLIFFLLKFTLNCSI